MGDRRPARVAALRESLTTAHIDALVLTSMPNIRYLTGFSGSSALLFVSVRDAVLVTDFRYQTQVAGEVGELARVSIDLRFGAEFTKLANQSATVVHEGQTNDFEVDTVISTIRRPAPPPLPTHRKPTIMIGESSGRRGLLEATLSGYRAALAT